MNEGRKDHLVRCGQAALGALHLDDDCDSPAEVTAKIDRLRAIVEPLERLRAEEGSAVTVVCDNPDFGPAPDCLVIVSGEWTEWQDRRFGGNSLADALRAAEVEHKAVTE